MSGKQDYCLHDYNIKCDVHNACDNIDAPPQLSPVFNLHSTGKKPHQTKQNSELRIPAALILQDTEYFYSSPVQQRPQGHG